MTVGNSSFEDGLENFATELILSYGKIRYTVGVMHYKMICQTRFDGDQNRVALTVT